MCSRTLNSAVEERKVSTPSRLCTRENEAPLLLTGQLGGSESVWRQWGKRNSYVSQELTPGRLACSGFIDSPLLSYFSEILRRLL